MLAPYEVELAKEPTKYAAYDAKEDEDEVVYRLVFGSVFGIEEDKFASAGRIKKLQGYRRSQTAEKSSPKDLTWEVCTDLRVVSIWY